MSMVLHPASAGTSHAGTDSNGVDRLDKPIIYYISSAQRRSSGGRGGQPRQQHGGAGGGVRGVREGAEPALPHQQHPGHHGLGLPVPGRGQYSSTEKSDPKRIRIFGGVFTPKTRPPTPGS